MSIDESRIESGQSGAEEGAGVRGIAGGTTYFAHVAGLEGHALGAYTLERPLGFGGMGTVWLAHRSDGRFEGHVAVKLLNAVPNRPAA